MKAKKQKSSIALIVWFLAAIIFLSAWNADRFVSMMKRELPGIAPADAKVRTDRWDAYYTRYFRFMEPLAEVGGISYLALNKKSVDNYYYIKDGNGNMQLLEDDFDRPRSEEQALRLADAFGQRGVPFIFLSLPPRFDKEDFRIANELNFFGQRDEKMLAAFEAAGVETLDAGRELKDEGARYLYPFKTDIHLETAGEFETARLLAGKLASLSVEIEDAGEIFDRNNYTVEAHSFVGNLVKSSGTAYTGGADCFELWRPVFDTDLTVENPKEGVLKSGPFESSVMNGMVAPENAGLNHTPYWVLNYLQYPSAYYTVDNDLRPDGARLLFIIDSFAMRTAAYLALGAGHITVIDPRGENSAFYLAQAMEEGEYDAVIVAAGGNTFYDSMDIK